MRSTLFGIILLTASSAVAQTTTRVSVSPEGWQSLEQTPAGAVDMTPDGRFIVFMAGDPNRGPTPGVYVWDRQTAAVTLAAALPYAYINNSGDVQRKPSMSDDGRFIAFVDGGLQRDDLVLLDRTTSTRTTISAAYPSGGGLLPDISADGRFVAFQSPSGVRVWDVLLALPRLFGTQTTLPGGRPRLSGDGRYLAFMRGRSGSQFSGDVYRYDFLTGLTAQVNTNASGVSASTGDAVVYDISGDGRFVLFNSASGDLVAGDDSSSLDLFLKEMQTGAITRVNLTSSGARAAMDVPGVSAMSPDARWIVFTSGAANVVSNDTNGLVDVFLHDRTGGTVERVNRPMNASEAYAGNSYTGIPSADGRSVAFVSEAHNLVPGDTNLWPDVFVHDRQGTRPCSVTVAPGGVAVVSSSGGSGTLTVTAPASCAWTATSTASWLHLTGAASGAGNGTVPYTFDAYQGAQVFARTGSVVVNNQAYGLRQRNTVLRPPFGSIDVPGGQNATLDNVSGSVAFSGSALDYEGVARVRLMRDPVAGEPAGQIYIGDATFVPGARPDVAATVFFLPYNHSAGWGYLLLTNTLPNQGNGSFKFSAYVDDVDGLSTFIGSRTLNCTNATATGPFGAIDTPAQGATVSGTIVNFGWALTPQPKSIPTDGSTISVFVDGVNVGHPTYNNFRSDIASYFPGYANTNGAIGYFALDTRTYADGVHTIAWVVTDSAGAATGIGSRYFTIDNTGTASGPVFIRRDDTAPLMAGGAVRVLTNGRSRLVWPGDDGTIAVAMSRDERLAVDLNPWGWSRTACDRYEGEAGGTGTLPVGSTLDRERGTFSWLPGPAFGGTHTLSFTRRRCGVAEERFTLRITFK